MNNLMLKIIPSFVVMFFLININSFAQEEHQHKTNDTSKSNHQIMLQQEMHEGMTKTDSTATKIMEDTTLNKSEMEEHHHDEMEMDGDKETEVSSEIKAWNTVCPVMGEEVDPSVETVEYNGKAYGFCCNRCVSKFLKNPTEYSLNLNEDGTKFIKEK